MNLNKAIIIGNVTADPEVRSTPSGQQVANFSVATNRMWTDRSTNEKQQKTEFHNVVAWGRLAEIVGQYLQKGGLVMIEGRIETRSWEDQNSGQRRYRTEIIAENMQLGPRGAGQGGGTGRPTASSSAAQSSRKDEDDDLPTIDAEQPTSSSDDEVDIKDIPF
ncbi:MAG: single-stranded DNA-binding protein [Candidatus Spechtbacterales bacterium]